jgi:hypothetical protein
MHRLIRLALTAGVLAGLVAAPASVAAQGAKIDGMYRSHGKNPDGSEYRGFVEVVRNGDSFVVSWLSPERSNQAVRITRTSVGVGILQGDVLAVSYTASRVPAIATYRVEAGGERLIGQWTVLNGRGSVYIETLEKLPASAEIPPINPDPPTERQTPRSAPSSPAEERFAL